MLVISDRLRMALTTNSLHVAVVFHHGGIPIHLCSLGDDGTLAVAICDGVYVLVIDGRGESVPSLVVVCWLLVETAVCAVHDGDGDVV